MMSRFLTELDAGLKAGSDSVWLLDKPLIYESGIAGLIEVPAGFETDFASVPRIPVFYMAFGDRAHREAVLHDYLYRKDSVPCVSFMEANRVFLEAMKLRGKPVYISYPMFWGVVIGGYFSYHKRKVKDKL
jgi:hypothetical protein